MTVRQLASEIEKLKPEQRRKLLRMLRISLPDDAPRGGPNDPLSRLIGMCSGVKDGSARYKEDLYGGDRPL